jgi:hypothetical protein
MNHVAPVVVAVCMPSCGSEGLWLVGESNPVLLVVYEAVNAIMAYIYA